MSCRPFTGDQHRPSPRLPPSPNNEHRIGTHEKDGALVTSENPFPDGTPVPVKFPRDKAEEQGDRGLWPWLRGVIEQRCQGEPPEWQVLVQDRSVAELEDGTAAPEGTPDDDLYWPRVFRDGSEISSPVCPQFVRRAGK